jgi:hypothetical protein
MYGYGVTNSRTTQGINTVGFTGGFSVMTAFLRKSMRQRVEAAFDSGKNSDLRDSYLDHLLENLRDVETALRKTLSIALAAMAAFELLARAAINKASIGPFEISDLSIIRIALPVLVAFLFLQLAALDGARGLLEDAYSSIMEIAHKELVETNLVMLVLPTAPVIQGPLLFGTDTPGYEKKRLIQALDNLFTGFSLVVFLGFEAYAYRIEFTRFGTSTLAMIALVVSAFLVTASLITFATSTGLTTGRPGVNGATV